MAKWIAESGTKVVILMCTNGNKGTGDRSFTPESLAATREIEQQNAANVLGVSEVVFLRYGDGELEDTHQYRGQVVREIRRHKPEVVFGIDPYRVTSHTHRDHRHSGQAALDAASHIVSDERLGEPRTNRELFTLLARGGWTDAELAAKLGDMAGFRNILVHGYDTVDLAVVEDVVAHRLGDLLEFAAVVRRRIGGG